MDQIRESLLVDQTADRDDSWGCGRKIRAPEFSEIQSVVKAKHPVRPIWKTPSQKLCRIIGFGNDQAGGIYKFIEADLEVSWRENVVRVRGKAEANANKLVDPKSGPCGEAGNARVDMLDPAFSQPDSHINGLVETKKSGPSPPFIERGNDLARYLFFSRSQADFVQQFRLLGQVMHTLNDVLVPILRWLIFRPANRENGRPQALSMQLSDLSIAKGLRERRKPLEEISQWRHRSELTGKASLEKSTVQSRDSGAASLRTSSASRERMLERIAKPLAITLTICLALPGCAHFTKSGRAQLAYQRYVQKRSHMRYRQRVKMKTPRQPIPAYAPSDYKIRAGAVDASSPQAVTSGESQSEQ